MGVPGLFRDLVRSVPLARLEDYTYDHVLFDYNSLLYHALRTVGDIGDCANDMDAILHMVSYTCQWIRKVNPSKSVFVGVDGPVPMAKLECQKSRRYKRVLEETYLAKLRRKYGQEKKGFDTTKLTPGTEFMDRLVWRLRAFLRLSTECTILLSDHHVPGEGEHKLIKYLQTLPAGDTVCVYGMDADLIVLTLMHGNPNTVLVRDTETGVEVLSVEACRSLLLCKLRPFPAEPDRALLDLCFLFSLGGNDFVRPLPGLVVRARGLDPIIQLYNALQEIRLVREDGTIAWDQLNRVFALAAVSEAKDITQVFGGRAARKRSRDDGVGLDAEIQTYYHASYWNRVNPFHQRALPILQKLDPEKVPFEEWNARYKTYYGLVDPAEVTRAYVESLAWSWHYYYTGVPPTWDYVYPYHAGPLASWFVDHPVVDPVSMPGRRKVPYTPLTQLAYVIPPASYGLLPRALRMPREKWSVRLDYLQGKHIYADAWVSGTDVETVEAAVQQSAAGFSARDAHRNKLFFKPRVLT